MKTILTDKTNTDFIALTKLLDAELNSRYGVLQKQYDLHNTVAHVSHVVVVYLENLSVACGAFKEFDMQTVEIKRVFVTPQYRRRGISRHIMQRLEADAKRIGYTYAVLETGRGQPEAIALYQSLGYVIIENYPPYADITTSICMKKSF